MADFLSILRTLPFFNPNKLYNMLKKILTLLLSIVLVVNTTIVVWPILISQSNDDFAILLKVSLVVFQIISVSLLWKQKDKWAITTAGSISIFLMFWEKVVVPTKAEAHGTIVNVWIGSTVIFSIIFIIDALVEVINLIPPPERIFWRRFWARLGIKKWAIKK